MRKHTIFLTLIMRSILLAFTIVLMWIPFASAEPATYGFSVNWHDGNIDYRPAPGTVASLFKVIQTDKAGTQAVLSNGLYSIGYTGDGADGRNVHYQLTIPDPVDGATYSLALFKDDIDALEQRHSVNVSGADTPDDETDAITSF